MKKLLLISILAILAISFNSCSDSRYGIKSGTITFANNMMGIEIKTTQHFKDYGDIELIITEMEFNGQKNKEYSLRRDGYMYSYIEGNPEGIKVKLNDSIADAEGNKLDEASVVKQGGKKTGNEKILGKDCIVYELPVNMSNSTIWVWENILLKMVANQNGMDMVYEAKEIKETSDFPAGIFDIPANVNFKEWTEEMQNNMLDDAEFENQEILEDTTAKG
jgi:hypothetical protein